MIKIVFCLHRLPHLTRADFQDYWRNVHAPLVARRAEVLGIRRYVQSHTLDNDTFAKLTSSRGGQEAFDGVAELWLAETESPTGDAKGEAARAAVELLEDEKKFIDLSRSIIFYAREPEILTAAP